MMVMRKILYIAALLLVIGLLGGCFSMGEKEMMSTAEKAMEEKYGVSFTAEGVRKYDHDSFYAWVSPADNPDFMAKALVSNDGSGVLDNYIPKKMAAIVTARVDYLMKDYEQEYYAHTENVQEYVTESNTSITPAAYLEAHPGDRLTVELFVERNVTDLSQLYTEVGKVKEGLNKSGGPDPSDGGLQRGSIIVYLIETGRLADVQYDIERWNDTTGDILNDILNEGSYIRISLDPKEPIPMEETFRRELQK